MWDSPVILPSSKSKEEKIEEARKSGLLEKAKTEQLCCKKCGSLNIIVLHPETSDPEKGVVLPYVCKDCGYEGEANLKIIGIDKNGILQTELVPQGLVGITNSFI